LGSCRRGAETFLKIPAGNQGVTCVAVRRLALVSLFITTNKQADSCCSVKLAGGAGAASLVMVFESGKPPNCLLALNICTKKPGTVSRPGAIRELQFPE
jgi:hypothetical protein